MTGVEDEVLASAVYHSRYPQYAAPQGEEEIAAYNHGYDRGEYAIEGVPPHHGLRFAPLIQEPGAR